MSNAVALPAPPSAIYREEQNFAWWVYAVLALLVGLCWMAPRALLAGRLPDPAAPPAVGQIGIQAPFAWMIGLGLPLLLLVGVLRMTTEVRPAAIRVWFGWIPTYRQEVPIAGVRSVEVVRYRPIADYGFWGVRRGRDGERVLHARGDRGVRLTLADGSRILIGSQRPEELAHAISKAIEAPGL